MNSIREQILNNRLELPVIRDQEPAIRGAGLPDAGRAAHGAALHDGAQLCGGARANGGLHHRADRLLRLQFRDTAYGQCFPGPGSADGRAARYQVRDNEREPDGQYDADDQRLLVARNRLPSIGWGAPADVFVRLFRQLPPQSATVCQDQ